MSLTPEVFHLLSSLHSLHPKCDKNFLLLLNQWKNSPLEDKSSLEKEIVEYSQHYSSLFLHYLALMGESTFFKALLQKGIGLESQAAMSVVVLAKTLAPKEIVQLIEQYEAKEQLELEASITHQSAP